MNLLLPKNRPGLHRFSRRALSLIAVHAAVFATAYFLAFFTRNDFSFEGAWLEKYLATVVGVVLVKLAIFYSMGLCHVSWGRVAFGDLTNLLLASTLSLLFFGAIDGLFLSTGRFPGFPRVRRSVLLLETRINLSSNLVTKVKKKSFDMGTATTKITHNTKIPSAEQIFDHG